MRNREVNLSCLFHILPQFLSYIDLFTHHSILYSTFLYFDPTLTFWLEIILDSLIWSIIILINNSSICVCLVSVFGTPHQIISSPFSNPWTHHITDVSSRLVCHLRFHSESPYNPTLLNFYQMYSYSHSPLLLIDTFSIINLLLLTSLSSSSLFKD